MGSAHSRLGAPQSAVVAQRQRPYLSPAFSRTHDVAPGQSALVSQRTPSWIGSSAGQVTPQLALEGMTISARKSPSTSATIGFSYQVQLVWYCENSTSPVRPSYTREKHSSA